MVKSGIQAVERRAKYAVDFTIPIQITRLVNLEDGMAFMRGSGQPEFFGVILAEPGYYCLAVWGEDVASPYRTGNYGLEIMYGVPGVKPNQANPRTEVSFEMAAGGGPILRVHNVAGLEQNPGRKRRLMFQLYPCY